MIERPSEVEVEAAEDEEAGLEAERVLVPALRVRDRVPGVWPSVASTAGGDVTPASTRHGHRHWGGHLAVQALVDHALHPAHANYHSEL